MSATEKVINDLNVAIFMLGNTQITLNQELRIRIGQAITSAIDLLKKQEEEYENGFNDAMHDKQESMYEGTEMDGMVNHR